MEHIYSTTERCFFDPCCVEYYKSIIKKLSSGSTLVELGVWTGASLSVLTIESINQNKQNVIVGIDPFSDVWYNTPPNTWNSLPGDVILNYVKSRFELYNLPLNIIRDFSYNAKNMFENNSLDFVFIDADHEYESVKKDIQDWLPKVKLGGILAGHDLHYHPVRKAVEECLPNFSTKCNHIWEITK